MILLHVPLVRCPVSLPSQISFIPPARIPYPSFNLHFFLHHWSSLLLFGGVMAGLAGLVAGQDYIHPYPSQNFAQVSEVKHRSQWN